MKKNEHSKVEQIENLAQLAEDNVNDEGVEFNSFVIDENIIHNYYIIQFVLVKHCFHILKY